MTNSKQQNQKRSNKTQTKSIASQMAIARLPTARTKVVLSINGTFTSSAGGVLAGAFSMNPSSADKWSQYASVYDCFRVVGGRLDLASQIPFNSGVNNSIVIFAFDNDSAATPASYSDVTPYSEMTRMPACWTSGAIKSVYFQRPTIRGVAQSTSPLWIDEGSPAGSLGALKFYGDNVQASTTYWHYVLEYLVEFMFHS
jgi:hypothetical protein